MIRQDVLLVKFLQRSVRLPAIFVPPPRMLSPHPKLARHAHPTRGLLPAVMQSLIAFVTKAMVKAMVALALHAPQESIKNLASKNVQVRPFLKNILQLCEITQNFKLIGHRDRQRLLNSDLHFSRM